MGLPGNLIITNQPTTIKLLKSFLLKDNKPITKWGLLPDNTFFEGEVPEGYKLAISPSGNIVILDIDFKNGKNGYEHIPSHIQTELDQSFNYKTKSGGAHIWLCYTGSRKLMNRSTTLGLDLRIGSKGKNSGGYVKYNHTEDIRKCLHLIKGTSNEMNEWLEDLFAFKTERCLK